MFAVAAGGVAVVVCAADVVGVEEVAASGYGDDVVGGECPWCAGWCVVVDGSAAEGAG